MSVLAISKEILEHEINGVRVKTSQNQMNLGARDYSTFIKGHS